jgi:predicted phosphodiesterase
MKIGFVSDIHEDISTLKRAFRTLEQMQVDEVVCLGDIVGYSVPFYNFMTERDANAVVDLVRSNCSATVIGNHDLFAVKRIPDNRSFFNYPEDWYERDYDDRRTLAADKIYLYEYNELPSLLSAKNKDFIRGLPEQVIRDCGDHSLLFTHYAMPDCTGSSIWAPKEPGELASHFNFMGQKGCLYSFSGNDHIEGMQIFTKDSKLDTSFQTVKLPDEKIWVHGPAVTRGTTLNGFMVYDSNSRELTAVPLQSDKHIVPQYI